MVSLQDRYFLFKSLYRKHGVKALIRQFRFTAWRPYSRALIREYVSNFDHQNMRGIEIGVGAQTIAPIRHTLLTDAFQTHASDGSLATEFFPADQIPYPDASFAFLLSEHVLEHLANPLKALREWKRVLKPNGVLFLFLPHPDRTFDEGRMLTSLAHLIEDENDAQKNDAHKKEDAHYQEWAETVLNKNRAPHYAKLSKEECLKTNSLHRHVWNEQTMAEVLKHVGFKVVFKIAEVKDRNDSFVCDCDTRVSR